MEKKTPKIAGQNSDQERMKMLVAMLCLVFILVFPVILSLFEAQMQSASTASLTKITRNTALESKLRKMVAGYPIERMIPQIALHEENVAGFLVAIAKKESNWGKRKPVLSGKDCFNYWGFRESRDRMGSGGHTCFDNPKDAVRSVAGRIDKLINQYQRDTAGEMVVWKCGYSCAGHSSEGVEKWIRDVDYYYQKASQ